MLRQLQGVSFEENMIREMRQEEVPGVAKLYEAANPHATAAQIASWTAWIIEEFPDLALVLEEDGKLIGAISGDVEQLLEELLRRFKARRITKVQLGVHYRCGSALAFYYRHGFRMSRIVHDGYGPGHDYIELEREIP